MTDTWAESGGKWLTGRADGPSLDVIGNPAGATEKALDLLRQRARNPTSLPDARVLGERAALLGLRRNGATSAGGAGRLLLASDGWVALSLARASDQELLPALIESAVDEDPWSTVSTWTAKHTREEFALRAALLGLPAAVVPDGVPARRRAAVLVQVHNEVHAGRTDSARRRVLDLSSLWAGPLCAHLLGLLGADVVKVESTRRHDGARLGNATFYDLLHAGHRSVELDLTHTDDLNQLRRLIERADLVIEASRPRALQQFGVRAHDVVSEGTSWLSITAYGREGEDALRIGFGDDVAAGAGLLAWDGAGPLFAADALADPLTGVIAAEAAADVLWSGKTALIDVSMHDVARECAALVAAQAVGDTSPPYARRPWARAAPLGAHTQEVLDEW